MNTRKYPYYIFLFILLISLSSAWGQTVAPYPCLHAIEAKTIDGVLADWCEPVDSLTSWNWRHAAEKPAVYGGKDDCSAIISFAWDEEQLYFAINITDDYHLGRRNPQEGDSLTLTFAPAYTDNTLPVEIAISEAGGLAQAFSRNESGDWQEEAGIKVGMTISNHFLPPDPYPCEKDKAMATVIRDVKYELALPWKILPFISAKNDSEFGVLLQIQDVDDKIIRGYLRWRGLRDAPLTTTGFGKIVLTTAND